MVIPTAPQRSLKKRSYHGSGLCSISVHNSSNRVTRYRCANTIKYIQGISGPCEFRNPYISVHVRGESLSSILCHFLRKCRESYKCNFVFKWCAHIYHYVKTWRNSLEIRAYIQNCSKIGRSAKSIYNELVNLYDRDSFWMGKANPSWEQSS